MQTKKNNPGVITFFDENASQFAASVSGFKYAEIIFDKIPFQVFRQI